MPEFMPEQINELAVKEACKQGFDGIRLLGATLPGKEMNYFKLA